MQFVGLALPTWLLLAAVCGALVVAAYVLKLRRRPVPVVFVPLWQSLLRDTEATSLFSQLKRWLSLLLQLVLLALVLLALADPRLAGRVTKARHVVVLVDASASMQATDTIPSRIEVARQRLGQIVGSMGGSDRVLIAQMDAAVTPLSTMTDERTELQQAIEQIRATEAPADFSRALEFAIDSLQGLENPEILVISDGNLAMDLPADGSVDLGLIKLSYLAVGKDDVNAAITQFSVRRYPLDKSRYEVLAEIANTSTKPLDLELSVYGDDILVDLTRLRVEAGQRLPRFYPNLSGARRFLQARLALAGARRDSLPVDDVAYALLPERKRARVLCVTAGNTYLEAALLLDEYLDVTVIDPARYPPANQSFDVTIFDGVTPDVAHDSGALIYLYPQGDRSPVEVEPGSLSTVGFDTWDKDSPLLRWTTIQNVNVASALRLKPRKEDKIVGASFDGPLLVSGHRSGKPFVVLGFDIRQSDLPLRISWPLLLLNTINEFMQDDASYLSSYRTGTVWRLPIDGVVGKDATTAELRDPRGERLRLPIVQDRAVYLGQTAGLYELHAGQADEQRSVQFAANLSDVAESTIAPRDVLTVAGVEAKAFDDFGTGIRREFWIYLLLIAMALSTLEWITYHRRITV